MFGFLFLLFHASYTFIQQYFISNSYHYFIYFEFWNAHKYAYTWSSWTSCSLDVFLCEGSDWLRLSIFLLNFNEYILLILYNCSLFNNAYMCAGQHASAHVSMHKYLLVTWVCINVNVFMNMSCLTSECRLCTCVYVFPSLLECELF